MSTTPGNKDNQPTDHDGELDEDELNQVAGGAGPGNPISAKLEQPTDARPASRGGVRVAVGDLNGDG